MGSGRAVWRATVLGLLLTGFILAGKVAAAEGPTIHVLQAGKQLSLQCQGITGHVKWMRDGAQLSESHPTFPLGSVMDDPRGVFHCNNSEPLQVFVRMCQNCIELNLPTVCGILVASLVATLFLAVAVYCIAAEESGWQPRASEKQNLLANEQLYQPLGENTNGQYSHIGAAKARRR
ncbi:T-cell surface glycoprotein CD3 gamma chain [Varanus komodoensis]|uniref:CD3 gamma/delta subunit Ig-like domain-containing protein n=1 Tax=Varanus komodoensis TaxID=61221 RepID=A0A8D2JDI7_VARKO|nr:T-cell surface glycoprotein CD3 gamma chain-like [Varanus komodoensis]KAF7235398.1 T-cell surface glycoprotein CD3 gamma chain [Varanus komodoensis]